jgi:GDP-D-mannose dehydratase
MIFDANSHVRIYSDSGIYTVDAVGMGTLRLLEAIRDYQHHPMVMRFVFIKLVLQRDV